MKGGGGAEVSAVVEEENFLAFHRPRQRIRVVRVGRMMRKLEGNRVELWIGVTPKTVTVHLADEGQTWCYGWEGEAVDALKAALVME